MSALTKEELFFNFFTLLETNPVSLMDWKDEPIALDAWRSGTAQGLNNGSRSCVGFGSWSSSSLNPTVCSSGTLKIGTSLLSYEVADTSKARS
jgi:hypothetical protein